ncbi:MAG: hypothetical protein QM749_03635 [Aquabacterium sp.]
MRNRPCAFAIGKVPEYLAHDIGLFLVNRQYPPALCLDAAIAIAAASRAEPPVKLTSKAAMGFLAQVIEI